MTLCAGIEYARRRGAALCREARPSRRARKLWPSVAIEEPIVRSWIELPAAALRRAIARAAPGPEEGSGASVRGIAWMALTERAAGTGRWSLPSRHELCERHRKEERRAATRASSQASATARKRRRARSPQAGPVREHERSSAPSTMTRRGARLLGGARQRQRQGELRRLSSSRGARLATTCPALGTRRTRKQRGDHGLAAAAFVSASCDRKPASASPMTTAASRASPVRRGALQAGRGGREMARHAFVCMRPAPHDHAIGSTTSPSIARPPSFSRLRAMNVDQEAACARDARACSVRVRSWDPRFTSRLTARSGARAHRHHGPDPVRWLISQMHASDREACSASGVLHAASATSYQTNACPAFRRLALLEARRGGLAGSRLPPLIGLALAAFCRSLPLTKAQCCKPRWCRAARVCACS